MSGSNPSPRLTPAAIAAAASPVAAPVVLVELDFASGFFRAWTGIGPLHWAGKVFEGLGAIGAVSEIEETVELRAVRLTLSLSPVPQEVVDIALAERSFVVQTTHAKEFALAHWLVGGADGGRLCLRCCDAAGIVRENIAGDALASGTTLQWAPTSKTWQAGAVMQESDLNRRQTVRFGPEVAFAQIGVIGFDGQIEVEALRLYGLPEDAPAILFGCPALPAGGRTLMFSASWDLPSMPPGATSNADVTVPGARRGDFADASLDTSSIAFV
jgi:hypothetical protein